MSADVSEFLRVYRLVKVGRKTVSRVLIGAMPQGTPLGSLACSASLCKHYYQLDLQESVRLNKWLPESRIKNHHLKVWGNGC